jgi:hypothetical protein
MAAALTLLVLGFLEKVPAIEVRAAILIATAIFHLCALVLFVESSSIFEDLWSFGATKIAATGIVSGLFFLSRIQAGEYVNAVFPLDPSNLPATTAIVTAIDIFSNLQIFFFLALILSVVLLLCAFFTESNSSSFVLFIVSAIFSSLVFLIVIRSHWTDETRPYYVYTIAQAVDFREALLCDSSTEVSGEKRFVYIGQGQDHVMSIPRQPYYGFPLDRIAAINWKMPSQAFSIVRCRREVTRSLGTQPMDSADIPDQEFSTRLPALQPQ